MKGAFTMQFQVSTDYAIRILHYLHTNKALTTAQDISVAVGVTYPFFIKIANQLKKEGLLTTVQGRHGGYLLAKPADQINLYDVFVAIEGEMALNRCLQTDQRCNRNEEEHCALHSYFSKVQATLISHLANAFISDFDTIVPHRKSA